MSDQIRKRPVPGIVLAGVLGLGAMQSALAVDMTVSASVQNTLTATVDSELKFGKLFVTKALDGFSSSAVRAPATAGQTTLTSIAVGTGMTFMSLGEAERGEVSVAIPPNSTTPYTVTLSGLVDGINTGATCGTSTNGVLELAHSSGNPNVPKFNVHTWSLATGTGTTAVGTVTPTGTDGTATASVTPAFGAGPSVFYLGATISTECVTADVAYEELGSYVGTLTIDVGY